MLSNFFLLIFSLNSEKKHVKNHDKFFRTGSSSILYT